MRKRVTRNRRITRLIIRINLPYLYIGAFFWYFRLKQTFIQPKKGSPQWQASLRSTNACQRDTVDVNSRFRNFFSSLVAINSTLISVANSKYHPTMLQKLSKCEVKAAWCSTICLPLRFYVKSKRTKRHFWHF